MFRRLIMFALGVVVGLILGHAQGFVHGVKVCKDEMLLLKESVRTVPREKP